VAEVRVLYEGGLVGRTVAWHSVTAYVSARRRI
jgi:hypothetical protein